MDCTNCGHETDTTCNGLPACEGCLIEARQYPDS
jgi:hypothetical protein